MSFSLAAIFACAPLHNAAACTLSVSIPAGEETIKVSRSLDDESAFSHAFYDSIATQNVTLQYYWKPAPGSLRVSVPVLSANFKEQGFTNLKVGTNLLLFDEDGRWWRISRIYEESWVDEFAMPNAALFEKFAGATAITAQLMLSRKNKPDKLLTQGTIDLVKLQAEYLALAEADKQLDAKQADYTNHCSNLNHVPEIAVNAGTAPNYPLPIPKILMGPQPPRLQKPPREMAPPKINYPAPISNGSGTKPN